MPTVDVDYGRRVNIGFDEVDDFGGSIYNITAGDSLPFGHYDKTKYIYYVLVGDVKITYIDGENLAITSAPAGSSFAIESGISFSLQALAESIVVGFSDADGSDFVEATPRDMLGEDQL